MHYSEVTLRLNIKEIEVPQEVVDSAYSSSFLNLNTDIPVNNYLILRSISNNKSTAFLQHMGKGVFCKVRSPESLTLTGLKPRDAKQTAFVNSLVDENILIHVATGSAGTGKTTLALAYALDRWINNKKPIILSKPTIMVGEGKAFGPVPGDMNEKYAPYLASYEIAIKRILGKHGASQLEMMKRKEGLQYVPVELVRGSEFAGCTFLLDEAQNLHWHELKTIMTRMGAETKMIIMGDLNQIDLPIKASETGLYKLLNSKPFEDSSVSSQIMLTTQYRSPVTQLIADVDTWIKQQEG